MVESLESRVVQLEVLLAERDVLLAAQAEVIAGLRSQVEELSARLGQDSGNSSAPPSRDRVDRRERRAAERTQRKVRDRVERGGEDRKPGKQPGAPGATLARRVPTRTVTHRPVACRGCGAGLDTARVVGQATRQVLEIPKPSIEVIDHIAERCRCSCGTETTAPFPSEATGPVCWGPRAKAVGSYLLARQHLPLERTAEAMRVLFDAPMGEGTLAGLLPDAAARLVPFTVELARLLGLAPVTHADETSIRVGTSLDWVHTISTPELTLLAHHTSRGFDAIEAIGILDGYTGTIVHDGYTTYNKLTGATHAQCGAHLLRHLDNVGRSARFEPWTMAMRRVLLDAKKAAETAAAAGLDQVPGPIAQPIRARYAQTLELAFTAMPAGPPPRRKHTGGWTSYERDAWNLAVRFRDSPDQIIRYLDDTRVPFDNNEAERSLRMAKLHDKISGCFRNPHHAEAFLTVRSYLQTGQKQAQHALELLTRLWTTTPWLPTVTEPSTG